MIGNFPQPFGVFADSRENGIPIETIALRGTPTGHTVQSPTAVGLFTCQRTTAITMTTGCVINSVIVAGADHLFVDHVTIEAISLDAMAAVHYG